MCYFTEAIYTVQYTQLRRLNLICDLLSKIQHRLHLQFCFLNGLIASVRKTTEVHNSQN